MKRFILQRFGLRTPLSLQQLEEAVFDAYTHINWKTVTVLTLSAKYRVQILIERNGGFIGDMVDECCRRARMEIESETDMIILSVPSGLGQPRQSPDAMEGREGLGEVQLSTGLPPLPSFRL